ncbi:trimethylamine monooxygenase [Marchantia polymorpha subsp. ruderalis]
MVAEMKKRVAVIGAGPSGLSLLRAFDSAAEKGAEIPEIVCFEKQGEVGGLWKFEEGKGVDEHGEIVHGSMYRDLYINGPKEVNEYVDYSFEEHYGKVIGSYPPRPVLLSYIRGRAEKYNLCAKFSVRFNSSVSKISYSEDTAKFTVTVKDRSTARNGTEAKVYSEDFDHVVVAVGHFSTPNVPQFPGLEAFKGSVLHAHDVRDLSEFRGMDVLLVGSGYTAEDIACQCFKLGAASVTITFRSNPTGCCNWPESIKEVPLLERVDSNGRTCHFKDGSSKDVDAIILCTGYLHDFPFMVGDELRLVAGNRMWPLGLYQGVVLETHPKVFYLGMQAQFYSFTMFDAQAWYVRDVIMGRLTLPSSTEEMVAHSRKWREAELAALAKLDVKPFQGDYVKELIRHTDCPITPEFVDKTQQMGVDWDKHKALDIMSYRDHAFVSAVTGNLARTHHTPWMQNFDDSLESYVNF